MKLPEALKRIAASDAELKKEHAELNQTVAEQTENIRKFRAGELTAEQLATTFEATTQALTDAIAD